MPPKFQRPHFRKTFQASPRIYWEASAAAYTEIRTENVIGASLEGWICNANMQRGSEHRLS
jgi:hypothetical protein